MAKSSRSPADYPTWRMAADASISLTSPEADALELVAQLPFAPVAHIAPFARTGERATLYRRIAHLVERRLVTTFDGPPHGHCRPRQLLLITNLGLAVLAWRHAVDSRELIRRWGLSHGAIAALLRQLPAVLSIYELLALLAASHVGWKARFLSWHGSWASTSSRLKETCGASRVRLPLCVVEWYSDCEQTRMGRYVLVADAGGLPPLVLRSRLARLARTQPTTGRAAPVVAIATTSHRRVEAWSALMASIAHTRRGGYLESCIYTWDSWRSGRVAIPWTGHLESAAQCAPQAVYRRFHERFRLWSHVPRPIDLKRAHAGVAEWDISRGGQAALDVIGRHPFLTTSSLGEVLGRDRRTARKWRSDLLRRGLIRTMDGDEIPPDLDNREEVLEATVRGLRLLAVSMGLSLAAAVRHHGLAGGGPMTPVGTRRALHAHMAHTVGADGVFVATARCARTQRDGALLEWRNAAASAHGRMRPDGYGLIRVGRREYGFFLEFDRGTVRPSSLRAKFATYHRYLSSSRAAYEYDGCPLLLVVASGPGSEQRIVDAVRAAVHAQGNRLPVLVSTTNWITGDAHGILGRIWRTAERPGRMSWPVVGSIA